MSEKARKAYEKIFLSPEFKELTFDEKKEYCSLIFGAVAGVLHRLKGPESVCLMADDIKNEIGKIEKAKAINPVLGEAH